METNGHPADAYPWYSIIPQGSDEIQQGDIIDHFKVFTPLDPDRHPTKAGSRAFEQTEYSLIILSQTCDLAQKKLDSVVTCPLYVKHDFEGLKGPEGKPHPVGRKDGLHNVRKGALPAFHLLNRSDRQGFERDFRIVDFGQIHSLLIADVRKYVMSVPHLRLLPPYREHLSQAFARFFMRVGLPSDIVLPGDAI